ncbi:phytochelatin synthase [Trifolium pratense]|uniref:glutathione gamma-glutamylcysteinyltransferase n=1 Tax=Trifolium pratense TaxID=57577 RepID=A0A2K3N4I7_TRIPR|nr:phytochelatin synthase [Trifolium pratense]
MNPKTGKRRGFITYNSVEEATSIALQASDGRDLHGRQVQVNYVDVRPHEGRPTRVYKLPVPSPPAVDLVSDQGKQLFGEAIQDGTMEGFCKLMSYFVTQYEVTFCGLATLSMVLNALAIDPGKPWKAPWRWFDESMLK